jgi:hypothetical protein
MGKYVKILRVTCWVYDPEDDRFHKLQVWGINDYRHGIWTCMKLMGETAGHDKRIAAEFYDDQFAILNADEFREFIELDYTFAFLVISPSMVFIVMKDSKDSDDDA